LASVRIRKLTLEDYDAILKVWERAALPFRPRGRDSRESMEKQMREFPDFSLGAFCEDRLVGVVIASYENRTKGWINRLAVDPEYQRQGIAQRLVKEAEEALKKRGVVVFCALIETPNDESVGLFRKMGYAVHRDILYVTKRKSQDV
jgi:ribosomal protein S18 acetylase RimI-like enzyme